MEQIGQLYSTKISFKLKILFWFWNLCTYLWTAFIKEGQTCIFVRHKGAHFNKATEHLCPHELCEELMVGLVSTLQEGWQTNTRHNVKKTYLSIQHGCQVPHIQIPWPIFHWWQVNSGSGNGLVPSGKSHYLNQCWPRSVSPCGVTRPPVSIIQQVIITCWIIEIGGLVTPQGDTDLGQHWFR